MNYTIKELADLAAISTRTLRYYDQIGLLRPKAYCESGYRIYGEAEVDILQQILFYKTLGLELTAIKNALNSPGFDRIAALEEQREKLLDRQRDLQLLLQNIERTLKKEKGLIKMTDKQKFEGLKKQIIKDNEKNYGAEIRDAYGIQMVEESNAKMMNLSQEQYNEMTQLGEEIKQLLEEAVKAGQLPAGSTGKKIAKLHQKWLSFTWPEYKKEAHRGLAEMYITDERFKSFYDSRVSGCAEFLRDAIIEYTS